eukprot:4281162-Amphidinium_carterae.3
MSSRASNHSRQHILSELLMVTLPIQPQLKCICGTHAGLCCLLVRDSKPVAKAMQFCYVLAIAIPRKAGMNSCARDNPAPNTQA